MIIKHVLHFFAAHFHKKSPVLSLTIVMQTIASAAALLSVAKQIKQTSGMIWQFQNYHHFSLIEPMIGTAMMSAFSVICIWYFLSSYIFFADKRMKQGIVQKLQDMEDELLLCNQVFALTNAMIRSNGSQIPQESLMLIMKQQFSNYIKVQCEFVDKYLKLVTVRAFNKQQVPIYETRVLLPAHDDVAKHDAFELKMLHNVANMPSITF